MKNEITRRTVVLNIIFILMLISQITNAQTEEFNNQQVVNEVTSPLVTSFIGNNYFIEDSDSNFVVFSTISRSPDDVVKPILLSFFDSSLNIIDSVFYDTDTNSRTNEHLSPADFILDGDDYIGCGHILYESSYLGFIHYNGFIFRYNNTSTELKEYVPDTSTNYLRFWTIERYDSESLVTSGSYFENTSQIPSVGNHLACAVFVDNDLDEISRYILDEDKTEYIDEVINDDDELVLLGIFQDQNYEGMVISHYNGIVFTDYKFIHVSVDFTPTAIVYYSDNYYISGLNQNDDYSVLIKLDDDFDQVWAYQYIFTDTAIQVSDIDVDFHDLTVEREDELIISGSADHDDSNDALIFKTNLNGVSTYSRFLGKEDDSESLEDIYISYNDEIVSVGTASNLNSGGIYLVKSDLSGNEECEWYEPENTAYSFTLTRTSIDGEWIDIEDLDGIVINSDSIELDQIDVCVLGPGEIISSLDNGTGQNIFNIIPNPVEATTVIELQLLQNSKVNLSVINMNGNIADLIINNELLDSGKYNITYDASNLANGSYYILLEYNGIIISKTLIVIK